MDNIEECGVEEGGMIPPAPTMPPKMDDGDPVSMNVSLNARGKDHVQDLINMMKNAGLGDAKEVEPEMMPMRTDIERLRDIVDGPKDKDMDDLKPGVQKEPCPKCGKVHIGMSSCNDSIEADDEAVAEYDNEPDENYGAIDDVLPSGNDLHKSKKGYKAAAGGDNPMDLEDDIKEQLYKAIQAKMAEGRGRGKKKAKEDIQATEGRGRGRGKKAKKEDAEDGADMEKCPECGSKKQKLMACSSCGCS